MKRDDDDCRPGYDEKYDDNPNFDVCDNCRRPSASVLTHVEMLLCEECFERAAIWREEVK
jgi:hypothetical protein